MKILKGILLLLLIGSCHSVYAGTIDSFSIELSDDEAKVGEALDLTITAIDKDNNIVDDYIGTILVFSETDPKAELPSIFSESSYTFTLADAGSVKFENAVIFNSEGRQDLHVYDLNNETDSVSGLIEIDIIKGEEQAELKTISISSPENGSTLTSSSIQVAGKTDSNHNIIVTANGTEYKAISNSDGIFEVSLNDVSDGSLNLKAKVLNSDEEAVGESSEVKVQVNASAPKILAISASPNEGFPDYSFDIELLSEKNLAKVELVMNDNITVLSETEDGKYTASLIAPSDLGEYSIDVTLQNELGVKSTNPGASSIKVIEKLVEPVEDDPEDDIDLNSGDDQSNLNGENKAPEKPELGISGLKLTKLKTKSILEWDAVSDATEYEVYMNDDDNLTLIDTVSDPRITIYITGDTIKYNDFYVKALSKDFKGQGDYEGDLSQAIQVQTGPEKYIFILILSLLGAAIFFHRRKLL